MSLKATLSSRLSLFAAHAADLLVPSVCAACGARTQPASPELCAACGWSLAESVAGQYCETCGEDRGAHLLIGGTCSSCRLGEDKQVRFDVFVRAGTYRSVLRDLLLRFKREFVLDRLLGGLLVAALKGRLAPEEVDYCIPIPSHWRRRWSRGFQPTALLARAVTSQWGGRPEQGLLMARYLPAFHQGISRAQRMQEIRGAFKVESSVKLRGRRVLLIDDVCNTGATLGEAKRVLRAAGAAWIGAAVVAKTTAMEEIVQAVDQ